MLVGKVTSVSGLSGRAEFISRVRIGDFIYYVASGNRKIVCQVTSLQSSPFRGTHGYFKILDIAGELPKSWAELYLLHKQLDTGHIEVGKTQKGYTVRLRVNPFFRHVLIAGITQKGKTHLQIVIQEEFLKHRIPSLIIDSQGEFVHLNEFDSNAIVTEEIRIEDILGYLKQRKTVVYNLQGLSYPVKAKRVYEALSQLMQAKEQDYKKAENDVRLLEIPPVIVDVDEAEIYAPELYTSILDPKCKEVLVDIAKRGSKYGIGVMVASQRPPQLNVDLRSQCNSTIMFHINDIGSRKVLGILPYITRFELNRVKNLLRGQCIITGELVEHPILIYVKDIQTRRAKKTDFEEMLGLNSKLVPNAITLDAPKPMASNERQCEVQPSLIQCQNGELVDPQTGEVVECVLEESEPAYDEGYLHVSKARTQHHGAPGRLGTNDKENFRILKKLKAMAKEHK